MNARSLNPLKVVPTTTPTSHHSLYRDLGRHTPVSAEINVEAKQLTMGSSPYTTNMGMKVAVQDMLVTPEILKATNKVVNKPSSTTISNEPADGVYASEKGREEGRATFSGSSTKDVTERNMGWWWWCSRGTARPH
jgi:hypothetical protein